MPWNAPFTCMGSSPMTCLPQRLPSLPSLRTNYFPADQHYEWPKDLYPPPPLNKYYGRIIIIIIIIILIQLEHVFLQYSGGGMTYVGQPASERRPGFPRQKANGFCHWILDYC